MRKWILLTLLLAGCASPVTRAPLRTPTGGENFEPKEFLNTVDINTMNNTLAAKIAARNHVNALANDLLPKILEAVKPFVGKKVALATGGMSAKLDAALDIFRATNLTDQVWFNARTYSLEVTFRTCFSIRGENGGCVYAEQAVTFADLERNSGNLKEVFPARTFRTDFTVEEIETARKEVTVARNAMREAEWKLVGFGEHDNG